MFMSACLQNIELAFITLNRNPIMVFADEIDRQSLANLQENRPKAYDAIRDVNHRKALVLTGLFQKSSRKGDPDNVELEYSGLATSWKSDGFFKFRQIFVGMSTWIQPTPDTWKFNPNFILTKPDDLNYVRRFDNLNYVQEFIESLFALIRPCDDGGRSTWQSIITDNWDNEIIRWTTNPRNAFIHVCSEILEKEMKNNENKIRGLIY